MTLEAMGAYGNLLDIAWKHGSLPDNERALQRFAMATDAEWARVRETVLAQFPIGADGERHNEKVDIKAPVISEAKAERQSGRAAGGRARAAQAARTGGRFTSKAHQQTADAGTSKPEMLVPAKPAEVTSIDQQNASIHQHHQQLTSSSPSPSPSITPNPFQPAAAIQRKPMSMPPTPISQREAKEATNDRPVSREPFDTGKALKAMPRASSDRRAAQAPAELVERLTLLGFDEAGVSLLWQRCREADPEATAAEVLAMMDTLKSRYAHRRIDNPIGMIITIVPAEFRSGGQAALKAYRAAAIERAKPWV